MTARELLHEAIRTGAADLRRRADLLDRINVFPVVDADTGVNMSQTLSATVSAIDDPKADISREVLLGARGNSGVILAQFLVGLLDSIGPGEDFDRAQVVDAIARGRELAYRAVSEPVEGTILTVMTALTGILDETDQVPDLTSHGELERRLAAAVAETPRLMPRLARAGVVDSGALGFHVFACGLTLLLPALEEPGPALDRLRDRLEGRESAPLGRIADRIDPAFLESARRDRSSLRYCVDLVIELDREPPAGWQQRFESLGASLDMVRRQELVKLHVHCNDPDRAAAAAADLGRVIETTTQDMVADLLRIEKDAGAAVAAAKPTAPGLRVLSDSSMSLDRGLARKHGIARIENYVNVHGEMVRDDDLDRDALFARMRDGTSFTTAQTSAEEVRQFLDDQLHPAGSAIYLAVGRAYTGTQDLVRGVAAEHPLGQRLTVLDTGAASGQQGLATLAAARYAPSATDLTDLVRYTEGQIGSCREYLVIDDLKYLSRTGRVGKVKAAFAGALSVKPIVGHGGDGAITWAKVRSHRAALREITRRVDDHPGSGALLLMVEHTDDIAWAEQVREALAASLADDTEIILSPLSSTSAVHMGPGTWGVAVTRPQG
jgi:DegV family protein with EDD domain